MGQEGPMQNRSMTAPSTGQQRVPLQLPARSATAKPDVGRGESEVMRQVQRSATSAVHPGIGRRGY